MKTRSISLTAFATLALAFGLLGCSTDSTNGASNRDDAATESTTSRKGQGLDTGIRDQREFGPMAGNSTVTPQDAATGSMSGVALSGDVTQDTSAVQEGPLNTSPSDLNGLPPAGEARETTSGTTSGAIVTEEQQQQVEKKKTKKMKKKTVPAQPSTETAPMDAPVEGQ